MVNTYTGISYLWRSFKIAKGNLTDLFAGGTGGNKQALGGVDLPLLDIPARSKISLLARTLSGSENIDTVLRVKEEW